MKKLIALFFFLCALSCGCSKEILKKNDNKELTSNIESDPIFLKWGMSINGRWIKYAFNNINHKNLAKDQLYTELNKKIKPIYTARKYYTDLLTDKYGDGAGNFTQLLDSLYTKNYTKVNTSLAKLEDMDKLYLEYEQIGKSKSSIQSIEDDLPEVVISACSMPTELVDFFRYYLNAIFPPTETGSTQEIIDCKNKNVREVAENIAMLRYDYNEGGHNCQFYSQRASDALAAYYQCDILDPGNGSSPTDPYPPIGGGGSGGGGGTTGPTQPTQECVDNLLADAAGLASTDLISSDIFNSDPTHRYITYTWECYKSLMPGLWSYQSRDVAYQQFINGEWQFTSVAHQSVTLSGILTAYSLTYSDVVPPKAVVENPYSAYVELAFSVRAMTYCTGYPFEVQISPPGAVARKVFTR